MGISMLLLPRAVRFLAFIALLRDVPHDDILLVRELADRAEHVFTSPMVLVRKLEMRQLMHTYPIVTTLVIL